MAKAKKEVKQEVKTVGVLTAVEPSTEPEGGLAPDYEAQIENIVKSEDFSRQEKAQLNKVIKAVSTAYHILNNSLTGGKLPVVVFFPCWSSPLMGDVERLKKEDGRLLMKVGIRPLGELKGTADFVHTMSKVVRDIAGELGEGTKPAPNADKLKAILAMIAPHSRACIEYCKALTSARDEQNKKARLFKREQEVKKAHRKADEPTTEEVIAGHNEDLQAKAEREKAVKDMQDKFTQSARKVIPEVMKMCPQNGEITRDVVEHLLGCFVEMVRGYVR